MMKRTRNVFGLILATALTLPAIAQQAAPAKPAEPAKQLASNPVPEPEQPVHTIQLTIKLIKAQQKVQRKLEKAQLKAQIAQMELQIFQQQARAALAADKATPSN